MHIFTYLYTDFVCFSIGLEEICRVIFFVQYFYFLFIINYYYYYFFFVEGG